MQPTEEAIRPEEATESEARIRAMLLEASAVAALVESGCHSPSYFLPLMTRELRVVHQGEGEFTVLATDKQGQIREGPQGYLTPLDLAHELSKDPGFHDIGWKTRIKNPMPSRLTGGR